MAASPLVSFSSYAWLAPLIHARVEALVLAQGVAQAPARAVDRPAAGRESAFCYIPRGIVALLRQEAMLRV